MGVTLAVVTTAASTASSIDQRKAAKRAERRQKKANQIERARAAVEQSVERKRAIAGARQAQASNIAGAVSQGIGIGSSPLQGAQASIGSDLGSSVAQANRSFVSGQQSFDLRQRAAFTNQGARANAALVQAGTKLLKGE